MLYVMLYVMGDGVLACYKGAFDEKQVRVDDLSMRGLCGKVW